MKFAPAYAKLFITRLEERLLTELFDAPLSIEMTYYSIGHMESEILDLFIYFLNSSHDTNKCTWEHSNKIIIIINNKLSYE